MILWERRSAAMNLEAGRLGRNTQKEPALPMRRPGLTT
jgi:hypothetical protein